jgi:hypothetical protein
MLRQLFETWPDFYSLIDTGDNFGNLNLRGARALPFRDRLWPSLRVESANGCALKMQELVEPKFCLDNQLIHCMQANG